MEPTGCLRTVCCTRMEEQGHRMAEVAGCLHEGMSEDPVPHLPWTLRHSLGRWNRPCSFAVRREAASRNNRTAITLGETSEASTFVATSKAVTIEGPPHLVEALEEDMVLNEDRLRSER